MLFGLLIVLPITLVLWALLRLFRRKSKLNFEDLHDLVGIAIVGLVVAAFFGALVIAMVIQIARHPWVLLILVPLSITATLIEQSRGSRNAKADPTTQRGSTPTPSA